MNKQNEYATSQVLCYHCLETVAIPHYFTQALITLTGPLAFDML